MLLSDLTHIQTHPNLIVIYIVTMLSTNWSTFVDAMVKTKSDSAAFSQIQGQITRTVLVQLNR